MIRISHPLRLDTPHYPGTPGPEVVPFHSIAAGDSSNASLFKVHSHAGTHLDTPLHFCPEGATVAEICGDEMVVEPVCCIEVPAEADARIGPECLPFLGDVAKGTRGLLLRTGWGRFRATDPRRYVSRNPWIDPALPRWLREQCPGLRIFGTDTISISSPDHREEGRACHRAFLCSDPPLLLLEDLDLSRKGLCGRPWRLRIIPWIVAPIDAVPVVAILEGTGSAGQ